jgi:hypothetical protein
MCVGGVAVAQSAQHLPTSWTIKDSEFESQYDQEFPLLLG